MRCSWFMEVVSAVEDALLRQLNVEICCDMLIWSGGSGMLQLEVAALAGQGGTAWRRRGGRGVMGKVWFPLMKEGYLGSHLVGLVNGADAAWMVAVVAEERRAKAALREGAATRFDFVLLSRRR